jgi:heme O synthase-like polyprenyltransferase
MSPSPAPCPSWNSVGRSASSGEYRQARAALASHRRHAYAKANMPMLQVTHGVEFTRLHILFDTVILFLIVLLPFLIGMWGRRLGYNVVHASKFLL